MSKKQKIMEKPPNKTWFAFKILTMAMIIAVTIISASASVHAFSFEIGIGGIHKQEKESEAPKSDNGFRQRRMTSKQVREAFRTANNDKTANLFLKSSFAGDAFCIATEERNMYLDIGEDGTVTLLSDAPKSCYSLKTSEDYMYNAWNRYKNGEKITYSEIRKNVKIPFTVKTKAAFGKGKK